MDSPSTGFWRQKESKSEPYFLPRGVEMESIRVLIADDHALVRAGIEALLKSLAGIRVVAKAGDGHEALRLIREVRPDIVLMDIRMPGLNGLEATERARRAFPEVRIIILSMHSNEEYVVQALRVGAAGYLLKDSGPEELELAVTTVAGGNTYLCQAVSGKLTAAYVARISGKTVQRGTEAGLFVKLTSRQREILQLIAEGSSTKNIATKLTISIKTVETHRTHLMKRLQIHDIAGLVRYAIQTGLIECS